ncbi:MAG: AMP-binding protein [Arenicellales bacterium]|jgi:long-chain acyl-CoA synthetase|nr:AMP-binding protein [Arenicellales bacterium]
MTDNIWNFIAPALRQRGDNLVWICRQSGASNREVQASTLYAGALNLAADLRARGIGAGDAVALTADNGPEWTAAALAIWKVGAAMVPVHSGSSEHEIEVQLAAVKPALVLSAGRALTNADLPITLNTDAAVMAAEEAIACEVSPAAEACLIYTSGSTGQPKIVRLSHANIVCNVEASAAVTDADDSDRFFALLPFSHAMGMTGVLLLALYHGAILVSPRVLAAAEILAALEEEHITVLVAVPRLFRNVMLGIEKKIAAAGPGMKAFVGLIRICPQGLKPALNAPLRKRFGGNIKDWVSGGSRLDPEITRYFHALGIPVRQGYGLTETAPVVSLQERYDSAPDSVGKPLPGVEVRIENPDESGSGELLVRGPNVMLGYTDPALTAEAMIEDWYRTGDIARIDAQGRITLTGRSKRLIVTDAGKNVYPEELETLLERDSAVTEAAVLELDARPVAVLAMAGGTPETEAQRVIRDFNQLVSSHNQISRFALIEELPRTPLGKIALHKLPQFFQQHEITR